jgi:hypothetical protein
MEMKEVIVGKEAGRKESLTVSVLSDVVLCA